MVQDDKNFVISLLQHIFFVFWVRVFSMQNNICHFSWTKERRKFFYEYFSHYCLDMFVILSDAQVRVIEGSLGKSYLSDFVDIPREESHRWSLSPPYSSPTIFHERRRSPSAMTSRFRFPSRPRHCSAEGCSSRSRSWPYRRICKPSQIRFHFSRSHVATA